MSVFSRVRVTRYLFLNRQSRSLKLFPGYPDLLSTLVEDAHCKSLEFIAGAMTVET